MYVTSGEKFLTTLLEYNEKQISQANLDGLYITFVTILGVTEALNSYRLLPEEKQVKRYFCY